MTEKHSVRQKYIDSIMKNKFGDDDEQYYDSNLGFLQSLSLEELQAMCDEDLDDCETDDDGNCPYCGQKCWEGEMCDEQQAGGFNNDECPVCGSTDTRKDFDNPETMRCCKTCGSDWNTSGDITLNGREVV